jgi:hypothetical protein
MTDKRNAVIATVFAVAIAALTLVALFRWWSAHPYPLWWDEANYVNQSIDDRQAFAERGMGGLARALLFNDPLRPPAYRVFALPFPSKVIVLRSVSLAVSLIALALLVLAVRGVSTTSGALLAAAMALAMPGVLTSAGWFGTEYPLFLAVAILMAALIPRVSAIGVALAVALGLLSKTTFVVIAGPALLVALLFARRDRRAVSQLFAGGVAGAAIAAGWWLWHARPALAYAQYGRTFPRASLGEGLATLPAKLRIFAFEGLGLGVAAALLVLLFAVRATKTTDEKRALLIAGAASLPLIVLAFGSNVFVPRHFAPALLPLVIVLAIAVQHTRPALRIVIALAVVVQAALVTLPQVEQTDWSRLRAIVSNPKPKIAFLGGWPSLTPPEVQFGWKRAGGDADVQWLWRFEQGAIDWPNVMKTALSSDVVLVVPPGARHRVDERMHIDENADNLHNAEFLTSLQNSGAFAPPTRFAIGTHEPVELILFSRPKSRPSAQQ